MSEVLEYRLKSLKVTVTLVATILSGGLVPLWISVHLAYGVVWLFITIMIGSVGLASKENGIHRRFWSIFTDFQDPPTDEWEKRLEQRNAFQVNYNE